MLELLKDSWDLIITILLSCLDIVQSALSLVIIDDPFWCGVEFTIVALLIWNNRKELIKLINRVPLLGGLAARGLIIVESSAEIVMEKINLLWCFVRSNTWDRAVSFISKTDKDLRE